jgi:hypothetical protein
MHIWRVKTVGNNMKFKAVIVIALIILISGCSHFRSSTVSSNAMGKTSTEGPNIVFYSFPDIPVPKELTLIREKSFIYETSSMKVGVLLLSGNVDTISLESYFKINMAKNGWRFINSYKYNDMILNFMKEDRSANIRITRDTFTTQAEIWVGPLEKGERGAPYIGTKANDNKRMD